MKTFTKDITKKDLLKEIEKHRKADQIVQGTYGKKNGQWRGCAVGCSIHSINNLKNTRYQTGNHSVYEKELGIPEWLARLEDTIFEGLPVEDAKKWPGQFIKAIPENVDLEPVKWKFSVYLMKENIDRVLGLDISDELKEEVVSGIRKVLAVHENAIKTGKWDKSAAASAAESAERSAAESAASAAESAASAAESAARSAAESAERSAWSAERSAWSAAASAAESAARSAASAARSAERSAAASAWSAAASAARSAAASAARSAWSAAESAWSAAYIKHSKKLLKLLKEAK
jgi:hypothetical protein